jgi:ubiquinone/menaquinone biosynthesis C-methylase UbiE
MHYLKYLASIGAVNIHPGAAAATTVLLQQLELRSQAKVLEVGCGTGGALLRISRQYDVWAVGIDILPEMLAVVSRKTRYARYHQHISIAQASAALLPFRAGTFDGVFAESVLGIQNAGTIRSALAEMRRVLKPGGRCVVNDAIWKDSVGDTVVAETNRLCEAAYGLTQASKDNWHLCDWINAINDAGFRILSHDRLSEMIDSLPASWTNLTAGRLARAYEPMRQRIAAMVTSRSHQRREYSAALQRTRDLGDLIEARLFTLST